MPTSKTAQLVADSAKRLYDECKREQNGRYLSWEHCHKAFSQARGHSACDTDYLSLHLAFYLASWGMYRGSSFLLSKDYLIHERVVDIILDPKYDALLDLECSKLLDANIQNLFRDLDGRVSDYYEKVRQQARGNTTGVSGTLVSKVLLGTLACVPAFDRYFIKGITSNKDAFSKKRGLGTYSDTSLYSIAEFYKDNENLLETARQQIKTQDGIAYPQMKILDMGFFQIGVDLEDATR